MRVRRVSENTVAQLMAGQQLAARRKKKRKSTTRPGKGRWRAPDLVKRDFPARQVNRQVVRRRHRDPHHGGQAAPGLGDGRGLPPGPRLCPLGAPSTPQPRLRCPGHGHRRARRPGPGRDHVTHDQGSEYTARLFPGVPASGWASRQWMGRPDPPWTTRSSRPWHSTLESGLRSVEHFATRARSGARVPAWIEDYNHHPPALGLPDDAARRLRAGADQRGGCLTMPRFSGPPRCAGARPRPGRSSSAGAARLRGPPPGRRQRSGSVLRWATENADPTEIRVPESLHVQGNPDTKRRSLSTVSKCAFIVAHGRA